MNILKWHNDLGGIWFVTWNRIRIWDHPFGFGMESVIPIHLFSSVVEMHIITVIDILFVDSFEI